MVLGAAGGVLGTHKGYWGAPGGCWCPAREQLRDAGVVLECSQGLLGCSWVVLSGAGSCWGVPGVAGLPSTCSSPISAWQLEQFKTDNEDIGFGSGTRALEQALERTRANINWVKENQATVMQWFKDHSS